jgi:transcriptional regulator with XRE-family HTH domain
VFEIGSSLREVRETKGLALGEVSAATRIRASHLAALENGRFDALPGRAYARAFLREYAEYLGLDGQSFLDELDERYPEVAEPPIVPVPLPQPVRLRPYVTTTAGIAAILLLGVLAWRSGGDGERTTTPPLPQPTVRLPPPAATHAAPAPAPATPTPRSRARLVLNARGRCWLEARVGSREGRIIFRDTLEAGGHVRFEAGRLWIRLGAPWNLIATLNGRPVALPDRIASIVVTPKGVRLAESPGAL